MHYFGNPGHTRSMIAYMTLSVSGKSSEKLHCGNVVNMPYSTANVFSCDKMISFTVVSF